MAFVMNWAFFQGLRLLTALAVVIFMIPATPVYAQQGLPAIIAHEVKTNVVTPGSFYKIDDLFFGKILASNAAGSVIVAHTGTRTASGGVVLVDNDHRPASFAGRSPTQTNGNRPVRLSIGSNAIQLTGPVGSTPMTVRNFSPSASPGQFLRTNPRNYQINNAANRTFELTVGAELLVNANQMPGIYTGTWTITADFP